MRIRSDGKYEYREDVADSVKEFYGTSRTRGMIAASEDVEQLAEAVVKLLEAENLSMSARREIAERMSRASRNLSFDFEADANGIEAEVVVED